METKVRVSEQGSLGWKDVLRGAGLSALTAALSVIITSLEAGNLNFNWTAIGVTALSTIIAYLIKNGVLEPTKVITTTNKEEAHEIANEINKVV